MEAIITSVLEKSLVGGAFLWLLYQYTMNFSKTLERVASTIDRMDSRMAQVEKDIEELKEAK